jgi:hypothetical protein
MPDKEPIAALTPEGFYADAAAALDGQVFFSDTLLDDFRSHPCETLYNLGFMPTSPHCSPGLA